MGVIWSPMLASIGFTMVMSIGFAMVMAIGLTMVMAIWSLIMVMTPIRSIITVWSTMAIVGSVRFTIVASVILAILVTFIMLMIISSIFTPMGPRSVRTLALMRSGDTANNLVQRPSNCRQNAVKSC